MTAREFLQWLTNAKKGQRLVYHTGNLQYDRQNQHREDFRQVEHVGSAAWAAYQKGKVALTQRRVGQDVCAYIAQRV